MDSLSCDRCGREYTPASPTDPIAAPPGTAPWGTFSGGTYCPDCQTADEQTELQDRIAAAIRSAIARTGDQDLNTEELALTLFALKPPPPRTMSATKNVSTGEASHTTTRLDCRITGASMFWSPLRADDLASETLQEQLEQRLGSSKEWGFPESIDEQDSYATGGGMKKAAKLILCTHRPPLGEDSPTFAEWSLQEVVINFYFFGTVTINAIMEPLSDTAKPLTEIGVDTKELFSIRTPEQEGNHQSGETSPADWIQNLLEKSTKSLQDAIEGISGTPNRKQQQENKELNMKLQWLHPIIIARHSSNPEKTATDLTSDFRSGTIRFRGGILKPGIGRSAISLTDTTANDIKVVLDTIDAHWAMYASYMQLDERLHQRLKFSNSGFASARKLANEAEEKFADYFHASVIRTRIDTFLASKGGDIQAVWDCISEVQCTPSLVAGVEHKINLIRELSERRSTQATEKTGRTINMTLFWLAIISAIAGLAAVITFFLDNLDGGGPSNFWRTACLSIAAVIFSVIVFAVLFITRMECFEKVSIRSKAVSKQADP